MVKQKTPVKTVGVDRGFINKKTPIEVCGSNRSYQLQA